MAHSKYDKATYASLNKLWEFSECLADFVLMSARRDYTDSAIKQFIVEKCKEDDNNGRAESNVQ